MHLYAMHVNVPEVDKCCYCCSLRWGIILFAYINIIVSLAAATCLLTSSAVSELKSITMDYTSLEVVTATVLFAIFGMGIILNVLLLVAGYQKDAAMLRLYICYATATAIAALVPTSILLARVQILEGFAAAFAIAMQCYVIVLVRSEILKLKRKKKTLDDSDCFPVEVEAVVDVPDTNTLV